MQLTPLHAKLYQKHPHFLSSPDSNLQTIASSISPTKTMALIFVELIIQIFKYLLLSIALYLLCKLLQERYCFGTSLTKDEEAMKRKVFKALPEDSVINLDHGDPTMFEGFWTKTGHKSTLVIDGWQSMSYFSDIKNLCWFLEPELAREITRLHRLVRNAKTHDRYIVVGTGSSQLFQAALYALSPADSTTPMNVVSALPYYSSYPAVTNYLKSGLYKWAGDAYKYDCNEPYIELVTSPNNPDGYTRQAVVNKTGGFVIHDLAYYWPHYTPITSPAENDLMLFTFSKSTGHAGTRIGWALVKDKEVAKKMVKFIELNTIGVSKDSQLRAARILKTVSDSCQNMGNSDESFFEYGRLLMSQRWKQLRTAVRQSGLFSLPDFKPELCSYAGQIIEPHPAFAWLRCEGEIEDCEKFLRDHRILTRSGKHFGMDTKYTRVSMLDRDETFNLFIERMSSISPVKRTKQTN